MSDNKFTLSVEQLMALLTTIGNNSQPQKINTTSNIKETTVDAGAVQRAFIRFSKEKKVPFSVAVPYGPQTGGFLKIGVNGNVVEIPADGNIYYLPESLAIHGRQLLKNLDASYSPEGFQINPTNASGYFSKAGLKSVDNNEVAEGVKVADVTHG